VQKKKEPPTGFWDQKMGNRESRVRKRLELNEEEKCEVYRYLKDNELDVDPVKHPSRTACWLARKKLQLWDEMIKSKSSEPSKSIIGILNEQAEWHYKHPIPYNSYYLYARECLQMQLSIKRLARKFELMRELKQLEDDDD
jgi:hypothetical protein